MMKSPSAPEWGLKEIEAKCPVRATLLATAGPPEQLIAGLSNALATAIREERIRFAVDSLCNARYRRRAIVQFHASVELYDWFFNARTGYRGQFYLSAEVGLAFNRALVSELDGGLGRLLPPTVLARIIEVFADNGRDERDAGGAPLERDFIKLSMTQLDAKIWICERLIQPNGDDPRPLAVLLGAVHPPRLDIARWKQGPVGDRSDGVRAPYPSAEEAWIDIKGGFVGKGGPGRPKDPYERARRLNETGWT